MTILRGNIIDNLYHIFDLFLFHIELVILSNLVVGQIIECHHFSIMNFSIYDPSVAMILSKAHFVKPVLKTGRSSCM